MRINMDPQVIMGVTGKISAVVLRKMNHHNVNRRMTAVIKP
jgi:hypothetical protein